MKSMGPRMESQPLFYMADPAVVCSVRLYGSLTCVGGALFCLTSGDVVALRLAVPQVCGAIQRPIWSVTFMTFVALL
jgi:hypothetical protein